MKTRLSIMKFFIFMVLLILTFNGVSQTLKLKPWSVRVNTNRISMIYTMKKNSIDVLVLGASTARHSIAPLEFYGDYGIYAFNLAIPNNTVIDSYFVLREFLKYQSPKVVFLEVDGFWYDTDRNSALRTFDEMKFSIDKLIWAYERSKHEGTPTLMRLVFPIYQYHTRWKELTKSDFTFDLSKYPDYAYGFYVDWPNRSGKEYVGFEIKETNKNYPSSFKSEYLINIVNLCKSRNIDLILYKSPHIGWTVEKSNGAAELAESNGIPYLEFNTSDMIQEIGLDFAIDSGDNSHLNISGAEKLTHYLADYVWDRHGANLQDKRTVAGYKELDDLFARYIQEKNNTYLAWESDIYKYLDMLRNPNYTVLISVKDEATKGLNAEILEKLALLGVKSDIEGKYRYSYLAVLENGEALHEELAQKHIEYTSVLSNGDAYSMKSAGFSYGNSSSIALLNKEYSINNRGLNIVIWDKSTEKIVDRVCFDTHTGLAATRK